MKGSKKSDSFLDKRNKIAVVGTSDNRNKWGYKVYSNLKSAGYEVYPVNPKHAKIDHDVCYPDLISLPSKPDVVLTVVPPRITEKIVRTCKDMAIDKIWMQPGSESRKAIDFCSKNNIKTAFNICFIARGSSK